MQPTISIDQRAGSANPRSTVATVTEIYDYLRLLMARLGTAYCYECGTPIRQQSAEEIQTELMQLPAGTKAMILAPMVRGRKGQHKDVFETIRKAGFQRGRVDGEVIDVGGEPPELEPRKNHTIEAVVDRIVIREGIEERLAESLNLAITHGEGAVLVAYQVRDPDQPDAGQWRDRVFSTLYACPNCKINYEELEPRTFSFNSPYGACPVCEGLGAREEFDPELVLGDENLSLADGLGAAVEGRHGGAGESSIAKRWRTFWRPTICSWDTPYAQWKPAAREKFLRGDGEAVSWAADDPGKAIRHGHQAGRFGAVGVVSRPDCVRGVRRGADSAGSAERAVRRQGDSRNRGADGDQGARVFRRAEGCEGRSADLRTAGRRNQQPPGVSR